MDLLNIVVREAKFLAKNANNPGRVYQYLSFKTGAGTRIKSFNKFVSFFAGKEGIEIGGPSKIFAAGQYIPVYPVAKQVDGCNFSNNTVWENTIQKGKTYNTGSTNIGYQHILDAVDLSPIASATYDFILSSHSLEHIANPIKALKEWLRVIKPGGAIIVILPDPRYTFDHNRPVTKFEHLLQDYNNNTTEEDLTHVDEVLRLHDLKMDPGARDAAHLKERSLDNINNRCLHQHVFSLDLIQRLLEYLGVEVIVSNVSYPFNLTVVGVKK